MEETVQDIFDYCRIEEISAENFIDLLEENGLMIVPIEDPTNLRFGIED